MRKNAKLAIGLVTATLSILTVGCGETYSSTGSIYTVDNVATPKDFDYESEITVVVRERGSGTRMSFNRAFDVFEDGGDYYLDHTYEEAEVSEHVEANIVNDYFAIGYMSFGAIDDFVKPINIDGVEPTEANIIDGRYKSYRPFMAVTNLEPSDLTTDFTNFLLSREAQEIVGDNYIGIDQKSKLYEGSGLSGKLVIGGSTSVAPVMTELVEEYKKINPNVEIKIEATGTTSGIDGVTNGTVDIAMASRKLILPELDNVKSVTFAYDGIAVVVNVHNPIDNLTSDQVYEIFTGEYRTWMLGVEDESFFEELEEAFDDMIDV